MRVGDTGAAVTALQADLVALGFPLAVDGVFGVRTDDAVRGLQLVTGLVVDGIAGPATLGAIAAGTWGTVKASPIFAALRRIERTNSATTHLVATLAEADVRWPEILADAFDSDSANAALSAMAEEWVADTVADPPDLVAGSGHSFVDGEVEATLLAASLVGACGKLSEYTSGAAHGNPRPVTVVADLAADELLAPGDLFMPGSDWRSALRDLALLSIPGITNPAGLDPTSDNYSHLTVTPTGVKVVFEPYQILPGAAGAPDFEASWADVATVIRPSIVARSLDGSFGGPGPHVS